MEDEREKKKLDSAEAEVAETELEEEAQTPAEKPSEEQQPEPNESTRGADEKEPVAPQGPVVRMMKITGIKVGERRRLADLENVENLAQSIAEHGLINPLTVTKKGRLISGLNRFEACKHLGWKEIPVIVKDVTDTDAKIVEIDENLVRKEFTYLERAEAILDKIAHYKALHPEIKHGGDRRSAAAKPSLQNGDLKRPSLQVAEEMHLGESTIRRSEELGKIIPQVRDLVRPTWIADHRDACHLLARTNTEQQEQVAKELIEKGPESVQEVSEKLAAKETKPKPRKTTSGRLKKTATPKEAPAPPTPASQDRVESIPTEIQPVPTVHLEPPKQGAEVKPSEGVEAEQESVKVTEAQVSKDRVEDIPLQEQAVGGDNEEPELPFEMPPINEVEEEAITDEQWTPKIGLNQDQPEWVQPLIEVEEDYPYSDYLLLAKIGDKSGFRKGKVLKAEMEIDGEIVKVSFVCEETDDLFACFRSEQVS
jgi:ParB family chromosome partitioning protein